MNAPHEPAVATAVQPLAAVAAAYLAAYKGRDESRYQRIGAWVRIIGDKPFAALTPDDIDATMATLAGEPARVYAGLDADEKPIYRKKDGGRSGATLNRYLVALGALYTWARRNRLVPRGFESPTKHIEKRTESRGRVRYLSKDEREALLTACQASAWPRL